MGPRTRRALHEALDHVLDAMAADAAEACTLPANPRAKKLRARPPVDASHVPDETKAKARAALARAGLL